MRRERGRLIHEIRKDFDQAHHAIRDRLIHADHVGLERLYDMHKLGTETFRFFQDF